MSTDYCPMKTISFAELFDGRMARYGVSEQIRPRETSDVTRTLTDGCNVLWVYADDNGTVAGMTRYGMSNAPGRILAAVAEAFDTEIFSEREPQYWGFDTKAEWDVWMDKLAEESDASFYTNIIKYLSGKPHDLKAGTVGMIKAKIAKDLFADNPELLDPERKSELMGAIDEIYSDEHAVRVILSDVEQEMVKLLATNLDGL